MFLLYINGLLNTFKNCVIHHFGDSTNLSYTNSNIKNIEGIINTEQKTLVNWFAANKISLNHSKIHLNLLRSARQHHSNVFNNKLRYSPVGLF